MDQVRATLTRALVVAALTTIPAATSFAAEAPAARPAARAADQDPTPAAQQAIEKGVAFLRTKQLPDGHWPGGERVPGVTALALTATVRSATHKPCDAALRKGYERLIAMQRADGAIAGEAELANYTTAAAVGALVAANDPAYRDHVDRGIAFLRTMQWNDITPKKPSGRRVTDPSDVWWGGFNYSGRWRPDLSNTGWSLEAMHDAGIKPDDRAFKDAITFVNRCQNRSESNKLRWATDDGGAIYGPENGEGNSPAGDYYDPADGRTVYWHSYGAMTATFLKSMLFCGVPKDDPRLVAAHRWIGKNWNLDEHPGMRLGDADAARFGLFYFYHCVARALHAYGEPTLTDAKGARHDWRATLIAKLAELQKPDGSWVGEERWMEENPSLATALALTALAEARDDLKAGR